MEVGDKIKCMPGGWRFSGDVADKFDQHIKKSVPFYTAGHDMIITISEFFMSENSICYEIGSSLGLLSYKIAKYNQNKNARFYGIEIEEDMIKNAKRQYKFYNLEYIHDNVVDFDFEKANLIISYYTLQFIDIENREKLLKKIYNSLKKGGAFIMFEKIRAETSEFQDITTALYTDFKIRNGYSFDEILAKSISLRGVLRPFSTEENLALLRHSGFHNILTIFKYITFEGYLMIKN